MTPDIPKSSGIYRITCIPTGKIYIGSAIDLRNRKSVHLYEFRNNKHRNPKMQNAWNKYGENAFVFEVLELILIPDLLIVREQYYLDTLKPFGKRGYNIDHTASSKLGMRHSPEARAKMSRAGMGNKRNLGKKLSPEQRAVLSALRKGNTYSLGYKHSPETRARRSAISLGKRHTPESIAKMREIQVDKMKTLIVTAPDGTEHHIRGVTAFCKENHLIRSCLMKVANGKQVHHKGWTARYP